MDKFQDGDSAGLGASLTVVFIRAYSIVHRLHHQQGLKSSCVRQRQETRGLEARASPFTMKYRADDVETSIDHQPGGNRAASGFPKFYAWKRQPLRRP